MDTWECLYERRSIREFDRGKEVPQDAIERIMRSAWYSLPAPGIYKPMFFPWRFIVNKKDQEMKDRLGDSGQEVAATMFGSKFEIFGPGHLWYMPPELRLRVAEYTTSGELWRYPQDAWVNFIPLIGKGWVDTIGYHTREIPNLIHFQGFATQNMWLVGHKYGISSAYNGVPLLDERRREVIGERLGLPRSWDSCGCFSFGHPAHPRYYGPTRPGPEGMVFSEYWGNPYVRLALRDKNYIGKVEFPEKDIEDVIKNINYVEEFEECPIPEWKIEKVMDAGIWGPMPEMFKAWRGVLVKDQQSKDFLQKIRTERMGVQWSSLWPERKFTVARGTPEEKMDEVEHVLDYKMGNTLSEASALIIISYSSCWNDIIETSPAATPQLMVDIAVGCSIQNMMIAATALDLGIDYDTIICGDYRNREIMKDYFGLPDSARPLGILALGTPGRKAKIERPPADTLFYDEYWGNFYPLKLDE